MDEASIERYRALFSSMYPVSDIVVTVRAPLPYSCSIRASSGWSRWLEHLTDLREQDAPPENTYFYGIAAPASSWGGYCNYGCISGLGWVPGRDSEYLRAAVGVSFDDGLNLYTSLHELGHTMGRKHTP